MSRRKRYSAQTAQEIKDIAWRLMSQKGTAGLSIRAIAREIEMTPPAIYTYFANLDDLITALIVDAFHAYAAALESARDEAVTQGDSLTAQLMAVTLMYREWAVTHPVHFQLIYGSPIPGYDAPRDLTVPAVQRIGDVFLGLLVKMWENGDLPLPDTSADIPPNIHQHLKTLAGDSAPEHIVYGLYEMYALWVILHGMVTLEVFNHLQGTVGDTAAFYRAQVIKHYRSLGLWRQ